MKIRIKKYHGEYEVSILVGKTVVWIWNLVMDTDGEFSSEEFAPHEQ